MKQRRSSTRLTARSSAGNEQLPTEQEINVYGSLDEQSAVKNFLGKNLAQAEALFQQNSLRYGEDLMWMGPRAIRFYVRAYIQYLLSDEATTDPGAVSQFAALIQFWRESDPLLIPSLQPTLIAAIDRLLNREWPDEMTAGAYGNLPAKLRSLRDQLLQP